MAEGGNCSDGVIVTLNGVLDIPPDNSTVTWRNPFPSDAKYCVLESCTRNTIQQINSKNILNR